MEQQEEIKNDKPVFKSRIGAFSVAIFLDDVNGRQLPSIAVEKSFTTDGTNWKHNKLRLLNATEADKLMCVLAEAKKALYTEDFAAE